MAQRVRECFYEKNIISGSVEMDETFIGGKEGNKYSSKKKRYRGTKNKTVVMGAISWEQKH